MVRVLLFGVLGQHKRTSGESYSRRYLASSYSRAAPLFWPLSLSIFQGLAPQIGT